MNGDVLIPVNLLVRMLNVNLPEAAVKEYMPQNAIPVSKGDISLAVSRSGHEIISRELIAGNVADFRPLACIKAMEIVIPCAAVRVFELKRVAVHLLRRKWAHADKRRDASCQAAIGVIGLVYD